MSNKLIHIEEYVDAKIGELVDQLENFRQAFEEMLEQEEDLTEKMLFEDFDGMFYQFLTPEDVDETVEASESTAPEAPGREIEAPTVLPVSTPGSLESSSEESAKLNVDPIEEAKLEAALLAKKVESPTIQLSADEKKKLKEQREQAFREKNKKKASEKPASETKQ